MAWFSDTWQQQDLKMLEKESLFKKQKQNQRKLYLSMKTVRNILLSANTTQETKMVKGSLHFHMKIMYVSLYTQLLHR